MIGDDIEISVLSIMGDKVRIGIQAPQGLSVFRKEIYVEIRREPGDSPFEREPSDSPSYAFGLSEDLAEPFEADARREVAAGMRKLASAEG